ncbi:hypothetical protein ABTX60_07205 [Streptomyces sp. NPDC126510]|uniref:hypothetical protein n=1 Tax=Streptomyces sp. NPDC126510 TaxID=3155317 RepID=UPI003317E74B
MSGESRPTPPRHRPRTAGVFLDLANLSGDLWCSACKALTGFSVDVVALHPGGVTVIGSVDGCVICTDPDDPEVQRG